MEKPRLYRPRARGDGPLNPQAPSPASSVEHHSGKTHTDENFPVGSLLIRRSLRPHVRAYYNFARNADDIADAPDLSPTEKLDRLDIMQSVLLGQRTEGSPTATTLRASLAETNVPAAHATDLLIAFRQDATKTRYEDWPALLDYCRHSAVPVGRYLLDLHREPATTHPGSDALCTSLQILNHLQDCAADLATLDRCYLPHSMLTAHNAPLTDLGAPATTPALRAVLNDLLTHCDALNATAQTLAPACQSRGMRLESAVIVALATRLATRLRKADPLATRVKLTKRDALTALLKALRHV